MHCCNWRVQSLQLGVMSAGQVRSLALLEILGQGESGRQCDSSFIVVFCNFFHRQIASGHTSNTVFQILDLRILYRQKSFTAQDRDKKGCKKIAGTALEIGRESVKAFGGLSLAVLLLSTFFCLYNTRRSGVEKLCSTCVLTVFAGKKNCKKQQ